MVAGGCAAEDVSLVRHLVALKAPLDVPLPAIVEAGAKVSTASGSGGRGEGFGLGMRGYSIERRVGWACNLWQSFRQRG